MSIKERFLDNIEEAVNLRFKDPIVLTFFISFLIVNWDLVLIAISVDKPYQVRIDDINSSLKLFENVSWALFSKEHFYSECWKIKGWHSLRYFAPLGITYFFLWKWPELMKTHLKSVLSKKVDTINLSIEANKLRKDIHDEYQKEIKLIKDDYESKLRVESELFKEKEQRISHLESEISVKDQRIGALTTEVEKNNIHSSKIVKGIDVNNMDIVQDLNSLNIYDFSYKYDIQPAEGREHYCTRCEILFNDLGDYFPSNDKISIARRYFQSDLRDPNKKGKITLNHYSSWLNTLLNENKNVQEVERLKSFTEKRVKELLNLLEKVIKFDS